MRWDLEFRVETETETDHVFARFMYTSLDRDPHVSSVVWEEDWKILVTVHFREGFSAPLMPALRHLNLQYPRRFPPTLFERLFDEDGL